jgi:hypothetical protein
VVSSFAGVSGKFIPDFRSDNFLWVFSGVAALGVSTGTESWSDKM